MDSSNHFQLCVVGLQEGAVTAAAEEASARVNTADPK